VSNATNSDHPAGDRPATVTPAAVSPDHISVLQDSCQALHDRRRSLLSSLRTLVAETQGYSERLRGKWGVHPPDGRSDGADGRRLEAHGLTPREAEVAALLARGLPNAAVARQLGISPHTARHHTQRVLAKLGVHSRAEAAARLLG
jgi:DNA-binding CsgD family transcriptional regulator